MNKILLGSIGTILTSGLLFFNAQPDGLLHVYALDIGQGDSILIHCPGGENILVDAGPGDAVIGQLNEVLPFFGRNIDAIFITNHDKDHFEGFIAVAKKYYVGRAYITGIAKKSSLYEYLLRVLKEKNIPVTIVDASSDLQLKDGVTLDILFPFHQIVGSHIKSNDSSIIAKLMYGKSTILLTGDSEEPQEEELVRADEEGKIDLSADILKVAHHGSKTSTTNSFLNAVRPELAVISAGKNNKYNHPHPTTMNRLQQNHISVYRTDTMGRVEIVISKDGIQKIKTER